MWVATLFSVKKEDLGEVEKTTLCPIGSVFMVDGVIEIRFMIFIGRCVDAFDMYYTKLYSVIIMSLW